MMLRHGGGAAVLGASLLVLALHPIAMHAQAVQGIVLDGVTHRPVKGADVALIGVKGKVVGRAMTGDDGRFAVSIPKFSAYHLEVSGLGYVPFTTETFFADFTQNVSAQVNLAPDAIRLEGLEVTTAAVDRKLRLAGFYDRKSKGLGYFIGPAEIQEKVGDNIMDVFRGLPGFHVRRVPATPTNPAGGWEVTARGGETQLITGGPCLPSVLVDGVVLRNGGAVLKRHSGDVNPLRGVGEWSEAVDPSNVAAMEIYPSGAGLPPQAAGSVSPCGAILIWTKGR